MPLKRRWKTSATASVTINTPETNHPGAPVCARWTRTAASAAAPSEARTTDSESDRSQMAMPNTAAPVSRSHQVGTILMPGLDPGERISASRVRMLGAAVFVEGSGRLNGRQSWSFRQCWVNLANARRCNWLT